MTKRQLKEMIRGIVRKQLFTESNEEINNVSDLYRVYGKEFPYASDAVAYYIFGNKDYDNVLVNAFKGAAGRNTEVDEYDVSKFMLDYEYGWQDSMEDIEEFIKNIETKSGDPLSDYY